MNNNNNILINVLNNLILYFLISFSILILIFSTKVKETGDHYSSTIIDIIDKTFTEDNLIANWKLTFFDKLGYQTILSKMGITKDNYINHIESIQKNKNEVKELTNKDITDKVLLTIFFVSIIVFILNVLPRLFGFSPKINVLQIIIFFLLLGLIQHIFYSYVTKHFKPLLPSEILDYLKLKLISEFK